ncbi:MAG: alpha/beta fold hydrolase [Bradymonadia bacterium]
MQPHLRLLRATALGAATLRLKGLGLRPQPVETEMGPLRLYCGDGGGALGTWVVLHGVGSHATAYGGLLSTLRPHVTRLVAPDLPGHGRSAGEPGHMTADQMVTAIEQALLETVEGPVVLLGCSLGGALAVKLALRRRLSVRAVVLCAPAGGPLSPERFEQFLGGFDPTTYRRALDFSGRLFRRPPWFTPLVAPLVQAEFQRPSIQSFFEQISAEDQFDAETLSALDAPTLVLWGAGERLLWPEHEAFYREHLPGGGAFEHIEDAGHSLHLEQPGVLVERAVAFVESRDP